MKKPYSAPEILFEDFSLSSSIAAGCEFIANAAENVCGYQSRYGMVFTEKVSGCDFKEPDTNDALCYHVPNDYANIFSS